MTRTTHEEDPNLTKEWSASVRNTVQHELAAFQEMLPQLLVSHAGKFVALSEGKLLDQDKDEFALAQRVFRNFPQRFVFIQKIVPAESE